MAIQCIDLHIDERQDTADLLPGADVPDEVDIRLLLTRIRCLIKGVHHEGGRHPVCFIYIRADDTPALLTQCPDHRVGTEGADRRDQGGTLCCIHTIAFLAALIPRHLLQEPCRRQRLRSCLHATVAVLYPSTMLQIRSTSSSARSGYIGRVRISWLTSSACGVSFTS